MPVDAPPAASPRLFTWELSGDVSSGFLQPTADDGHVNVLVQKVLNQHLPTLHHRHAFHEVSKPFVRNVPSGCRFDEGEVQFDPIPLVEQSLVVEGKRFIVGNPQFIVHKLPC